MKFKYTLSCKKCGWTKPCHPLVIGELMLTDFSKMQCSKCLNVLDADAKYEDPTTDRDGRQGSGGMMEFMKFPKIPRLKRGVVVTEKIDGTNAQVCIGPDGEFAVGSRKRWITPEDDNYGFARWASENKEELLKLGEGRHFGEWWGSGVQRGYGLTKGEKRFSLFNVGRWRDSLPTMVVGLVPILWGGLMEDLDVPNLMDDLKLSGSAAAPGFTNPEGIVVYHVAARQRFKVTYDDTAKNI